jgi:hypothetical protein
MRLIGNVARIGENMSKYTGLVAKWKESRQCEDQDVNDRIVLKRNIGKCDATVHTEFIWPSWKLLRTR